MVLPTDFLEKLLLLGITLIIAAVVGGGLDAAGIIRIPILTNGRTRTGIAVFGVLIMAFAYVSVDSAKAAQSRTNFSLEYENLIKGAAGIPTPPPWPDQAVADELEALAVSAGTDVGMNCELANFISVHRIPSNDWPATLSEKLIAASKGVSGLDLDCYRKAIASASAERSRSSCTVGSSTKSGTSQPSAASDASMSGVAYAVHFDNVVSARSLSPAAFAALGEEDVAQASEIAPETAGTSILEAVARPGQVGWMYLGEIVDGQLGSSRTILEHNPTVNSLATISEPVNLRAAGSDTNYREHQVISVIPPYSKVLIKAFSEGSTRYLWASVVIDHVNH
jgi:hypothetical protein